jgi:hypothetical protein
MERAVGVTYGDTARVKLDKVDALLAQTSTSVQDMALFADKTDVIQHWSLNHSSDGRRR